MEFRDLKKQYQVLKADIDMSIAKVINDANFISGSQVSELEKELAEYAGVKHCITCANGTDALSLVLMAWDIGEGDAVFVPDFTFFSTAEVVSFAGAMPIFVDVDKDTYNIDCDKLEKAIERVIKEGKYNPKVIIPVDLFGQPADYQRISEIADKYNLLILEDGAQGFGGEINGKKACSFGHASTTSFFPAKPLGCYGDGGAVFTDDEELASLIASYRIHGKGQFKYDNVRIGMNSRLDTLQAALLQVKLRAFKEYEIDAVNKVAQIYNDALNGVVKTPIIRSGYLSSWAQYVIQLQSEEQRAVLQQGLKEKGIPSMVYYPKPLHMQTAYKNLEIDSEELNVSSELCEKVLALPIHPYLNEEEVVFVSSEIKKCLEKK